MPDLTLTHVREAGRFAWHDTDMMRGWCLFVSGVGFIVWNWETYNYEALDDPPDDDEWRHIPGCTCEYCEPPAPDIPYGHHDHIPGCTCAFCK